MRSSATRSVNRSDRSMRVAVAASRVPRRPLARTRAPSSSGERAERSSSIGSTPTARTRALAAALRAAIEPAQGAGEPGLQPDDGAGGAQRVGDRDVLGDELAEDHRQRRWRAPGPGSWRARRRTGRARPTAVRPGRISDGDGGFGDVAGDQGGDRDGQLAAGELERQVAVGAGDGAGAAVVDGGGVAVDAAAFQGGEGELGRDGDGGAEGERDDGEQAERGEQDGHPSRQGPGMAPAVFWSPGRRWVRWAPGAPPPGRPGVRAASVGRGAGSAAAPSGVSIRGRHVSGDSRACHLGPRAGG